MFSDREFMSQDEDKTPMERGGSVGPTPRQRAVLGQKWVLLEASEPAKQASDKQKRTAVPRSQSLALQL